MSGQHKNHKLEASQNKNLSEKPAQHKKSELEKPAQHQKRESETPTKRKNHTSETPSEHKNCEFDLTDEGPTETVFHKKRESSGEDQDGITNAKLPRNDPGYEAGVVQSTHELEKDDDGDVTMCETKVKKIK